GRLRPRPCGKGEHLPYGIFAAPRGEPNLRRPVHGQACEDKPGNRSPRQRGSYRNRGDWVPLIRRLDLFASVHAHGSSTSNAPRYRRPLRAASDGHRGRGYEGMHAFRVSLERRQRPTRNLVQSARKGVAVSDPKTRRFFLGALTAASAVRVWGANDKV